MPAGALAALLSDYGRAWKFSASVIYAGDDEFFGRGVTSCVWWKISRTSGISKARYAEQAEDYGLHLQEKPLDLWFQNWETIQASFTCKPMQFETRLVICIMGNLSLPYD